MENVFEKENVFSKLSLHTESIQEQSKLNQDLF